MDPLSLRCLPDPAHLHHPAELAAATITEGGMLKPAYKYINEQRKTPKREADKEAVAATTTVSSAHAKQACQHHGTTLGVKGMKVFIVIAPTRN